MLGGDGGRRDLVEKAPDFMEAEEAIEDMVTMQRACATRKNPGLWEGGRFGGKRTH